ncbi:solute carrier family 13 member 2 [Dermacentor silvarum]|uniref:solute carrier family 13 member 2 n=1 Tax=Dermacentor silvarum TaxID=543639 RepID=UPI00189B4370|nr:solute carrier family 13 member 2 [Dermacentor silvarum]
MSESGLIKTLLRSWQLIYIVAVPLLLLPLPLYMESKAGLSAYAMLWMAFYWTAEPIPLPVTGLMPLVLFPLFGILTTADTTKMYFNNIGFVMFGSLVVAAAVEVSNLHQRLAIGSLLTVGTSNRRLLLGFMLVTMFMSMWIPNTASASIMVPIVMAVLDQIQVLTKDAEVTLISPLKSPEQQPGGEIVEEPLRTENDLHITQMRKVMLLSVAYAANIGGTGSVIGTPPNLILQALYTKQFKQDDLTFLAWMVYNVPPMLVCTFLAWVYTQWIVGRLTPKGTEQESREKIKQELQRRYSNLGPLKFQEAAVLFLTCVLILLWLTQNPRVVPGWASLFPYGKNITSCVPAVLITILMFVVPKDPLRGSKSLGLLTWDEANSKVHWGVVLIICGGMTLAEASKKSGLSTILVSKLRGLNVMPSYVVVSILCFSASMLTEFTSNTAISAIMLPIVFEMAMALEVHPLYFAIPVTIGCSFSFMLPAATPPNAIVFEMGNFKVSDMASPGFLMNMVCVTVELVCIHTLGPLVFGVQNFPPWAAHNVTETPAPSS